jgi:hypothetical protein
MTRVVGSVLLLSLVGHAVSQTDEVRRLTQEPLTTQSSMRLLHLTQTGDRSTKLFLIQKWGEIGPDACHHWERIASSRSGIYLNHVSFSGFLAEALHKAALSPDKKVAAAAVRSMAVWSWDPSRYLNKSIGGCGVIGGRHLPYKASQRLRDLAKSRWPLLRELLSDVDIRVFDGLAFYATYTEPEFLRREAKHRYGMAQTEETRSCAGFWYLYDRKSVDPKIVRAMDKEWRAEPPGWFRSFLTSSLGERLLGKFKHPPQGKLEGPYAELVERAKSGSATLLAEVISEAKTSEEFKLAMEALGDRALAEANGQEGNGLWKFWPESRSHVQRMLASERFISRYVACYVIAQLPREKFEPGEWVGYLDKMMKDPDSYINHGILARYCDVNDEDVQKALIHVLRAGNDPQLILKALDKVEERHASQLVEACAKSNHPQIREYAREILKQRYR